jgi:hypothetical protein
MNWIKGSKFKKSNTTYTITAVWFNQGKPSAYEFKTVSWDEPVRAYKMNAKEFESKITIDNYLGL